MRNGVATAWTGIAAPVAPDCAGGDTVNAAETKRIEFGRLDDGTIIEGAVLTNARGMSATVITLGATLQSLNVPDANGHSHDVVLGYDAAADYLQNPQYLGATVGRYANRIAAGRFSLDGAGYRLDTNDGPNHLHGGRDGFDKVVWRLVADGGAGDGSVTLRYISADGEGGYPGRLDTTATYRLSDDNTLTMEFRATTDRPTIVNLTNHSYFNLAGADSGASILDHVLELNAACYTPIDDTLIPTGEVLTVAGGPFDFRGPHAIGERIDDAGKQLRRGHGYDHNFVVDGEAGSLRRAARVRDPSSGRVLEVLSTAPGIQFYSGNFVNGNIPGKNGAHYAPRQAFCLEPQAYPDSPNEPAFPSARLAPGETYVHTMVLRFSGD